MAGTNNATIDFGSTPIAEASFTITDAAITDTMAVEAFIGGGDSTTDNTAADHQHAAASWQMSCVPASGSFTLNVACLIDLCFGQFQIRYAYA
jgi:zona occludens toxin (predicted ATPase)